MPNNSVIDPVVVNTISEIETVIEPSAPRSFNVVEIEALRTVIIEQPSVIVEVETPVTSVEVLLKDIEVVRVEAGLPGRPGSGGTGGLGSSVFATSVTAVGASAAWRQYGF